MNLGSELFETTMLPNIYTVSGLALDFNFRELMQHQVAQYQKYPLTPVRSVLQMAGGACYLKNIKNLSMANCTFRDNTALTGGAMYLFTVVYAQIRQCVFENNKAIWSAGAILAEGSKIYTQNCSFTGNYASSYGGAFSVNSTSLHIAHSDFANNTACVGCAICFKGYASPLFVTHSKIRNNTYRKIAPWSSR